MSAYIVYCKCLSLCQSRKDPRQPNNIFLAVTRKPVEKSNHENPSQEDYVDQAPSTILVAVHQTATRPSACPSACPTTCPTACATACPTTTAITSPAITRPGSGTLAA